MLKSIPLHQGLIPHHLVAELAAHRAIEGRQSTCYLDLNVARWGTADAVRIEVKNFLAEQRDRIDSLPHAERFALRRDLELVEQCIPETIGECHTRSLACFVAAERGFGQAISLPWPLRNRAFFEEQFVVWPLQLALDQSDRYGICLTDKDDGRLFHYFMGQIQEVSKIHDEIPGKIRFPDPQGELKYHHKHVLYYRRHLEKIGQAALQVWQRERFEHLIIGGLREILPEFAGLLHRYLRDRIVARWDIDAQHTPAPTIQERAEQEETRVRQRQAEATWQTIQEHRKQRGLLGADEVFRGLFQQRVQTLLVEPDVSRPGYRCQVCGRLQFQSEPCRECGGQTVPVANIHEEAIQDAIEQAAQVQYWNGPELKKLESLAALGRF